MLNDGIHWFYCESFLTTKNGILRHLGKLMNRVIILETGINVRLLDLSNHLRGLGLRILADV